MDDKTMALLIGAVAAVAIGLFFVLRYRGGGKLQWGKGSLSVEGSNPANVKLEDVRAGRDIKARDEVGGGVDISRAEAGQDIDVSSGNKR